MDLFTSPAIVAAGFPSPGEEWRQKRLDLRQLLDVSEQGTFCQRMAGGALSSMGIMHNDILVISPSLEAVNNDLVTASVNGSTFVRRLVVHHDITFLLPANPALADASHPSPVGLVHPAVRVKREDDFQIKGVVLCSIHAFHRQTGQQALRRARRLADLNVLLGLDSPGTYCTQVRGFSMQGAHIFDSDVLVVSRSQAAQENDIVVASIKGGFVVKRLLQARETMFLLSDHPLIPPLVATTEAGFQVWGVVMFSLHPLHHLIRQRLSQRQGRRQ
jgi:DNA polymerase V